MKMGIIILLIFLNGNAFCSETITFKEWDFVGARRILFSDYFESSVILKLIVSKSDHSTVIKVINKSSASPFQSCGDIEFKVSVKGNFSYLFLTEIYGNSVYDIRKEEWLDKSSIPIEGPTLVMSEEGINYFFVCSGDRWLRVTTD